MDKQRGGGVVLTKVLSILLAYLCSSIFLTLKNMKWHGRYLTALNEIVLLFFQWLCCTCSINEVICTMCCYFVKSWMFV